MYLRYHHLKQLVGFTTSFDYWKQQSLRGAPPITIADLYKFPTIAEQFINQDLYYLGQAINFDITVNKQEGNDDSVLYDYVGNNAEFFEEYLDQLEGNYKELLLTPPNTEITLGYNTDDICKSCQVKVPKQEVGPHCVDSFGNHDDYIWEKTLEALHDPHIHRLNGKTEYVTKIGVLRSLAATDQLGRYYDEIYKEVNDTMPKLIRAGELYIDAETGYTKVHPRYVGKERY